MLVYNVINNGEGQQYDYFTCLVRLDDRSCDLPYLPAEQVEQVVADCWRTDEISPARLDAVETYIAGHLGTLAAESEKEVTLLNRRIAKVKAERIKWAESAMNETVPADIARDKQTELAAQLVELERACTDASGLATGQAGSCERVLAFVRQGASVYETADLSTRRAYNQYVHEAITLDTDDGQIGSVATKTEAFAALDQLAEQASGCVRRPASARRQASLRVQCRCRATRCTIKRCRRDGLELVTRCTTAGGSTNANRLVRRHFW